MKTWQELALEYSAQGLKPIEVTRRIEEELGVGSIEGDIYHRVYYYIQKHKKQQDLEKEKRVAIQNQEPETHETNWDGTEIITFGLMGDTQMGSKYTQITYLHNFYDILAANGIKDVYHTGDITDGLKMRAGHEYELYLISADEMRDDVIKNYPKREGITTHFITGNHDASIYKQVGYDIGQAIANQRPDMKYLGRDCAIVKLTPNCTLELRHPWDGTAYALSYKPQKMIEAMESDSKPNILAIGHYHKAEYLFYRNVHTFQTGCFQSQTPFTRGKGISVHIGGWIITVQVGTDGTIRSITPTFIPYYNSIKDDYKNFK
jgi:UDP-2,3-diacylglucosamine pyrophosphatase LpxH|nr:MAG TPA: metallophosphatase domain protein [Caudoviricetes sp.]